MPPPTRARTVRADSVQPLVVRDEPPPLPFQALDRLASVRAALDEEVSVLIGQLQPYVTTNPTPIASVIGELHAEDVGDGLSSLEDRIEREIDAFREIHTNVAGLREGLRL